MNKYEVVCPGQVKEIIEADFMQEYGSGSLHFYKWDTRVEPRSNELIVIYIHGQWYQVNKIN